MFRLFASPRRANSPANRPSTRLFLEGLEARDCPAFTLAPLVTAPVGSLVQQINPTSITLNMTYGTQHEVTLAGKVTDPAPAGRTVNFTGVVTGQTLTDANGNYKITLTASALGVLTASVVGSKGGLAVTASVTVSNVAPVISEFTAAETGSNIWTFSGKVTDEHAAGLTIVFGGGPASLQGQTAVVGDDGWFHLTIQFTGDTADLGIATAMITNDWWGATSNTVNTAVT